MTSTNQRPGPLVLLLHHHRSDVEIIAYLKNNGLRVESRRNDADILATVVELHPDVIVLDFAVNGDTVETLKSDGRTHHIPRIALGDICRMASRISERR